MTSRALTKALPAAILRPDKDTTPFFFPPKSQPTFGRTSWCASWFTACWIFLEVWQEDLGMGPVLLRLISPQWIHFRSPGLTGDIFKLFMSLSNVCHIARHFLERDCDQTCDGLQKARQQDKYTPLSHQL